MAGCGWPPTRGPRACDTARGALHQAGKTASQPGRPRAVAAPWRAQQVVADQPVVGDLPDLVPGQRPDPDAANEVLADATDGAERELQPGRRGRDRRRDVELDGQLREAKLDAVRAGCPADEPADRRHRARDASAECRRDENGDAACAQELADQHHRCRVPPAKRFAQVGIDRPHQLRLSAPQHEAPHGDDKAAEADPARRWTGRARCLIAPAEPLPGRAVDAHPARESQGDRVRRLAVPRQQRLSGRDDQRRALTGDAWVKRERRRLLRAHASGARGQRQRKAGPRGYVAPAQPRNPLSAAGEWTMIRPRLRLIAPSFSSQCSTRAVSAFCAPASRARSDVLPTSSRFSSPGWRICRASTWASSVARMRPLTVEVALAKRRSSARCRSPATRTAMLIAASALPCRIAISSSREIAIAVVGSTACNVAERVSRGKGASSPTSPPCPMWASVIGWPSTRRRITFTRPLWIA